MQMTFGGHSGNALAVLPHPCVSNPFPGWCFCFAWEVLWQGRKAELGELMEREIVVVS